MNNLHNLKRLTLKWGLSLEDFYSWYQPLIKALRYLNNVNSESVEHILRKMWKLFSFKTLSQKFYLSSSTFQFTHGDFKILFLSFPKSIFSYSCNAKILQLNKLILSVWWIFAHLSINLYRRPLVPGLPWRENERLPYKIPTWTKMFLL